MAVLRTRVRPAAGGMIRHVMKSERTAPSGPRAQEVFGRAEVEVEERADGQAAQQLRAGNLWGREAVRLAGQDASPQRQRFAH